MKWFREKYQRILQRLCRRELRAIADDYPHTRESLIRYFDFLAIECINEDTKARERALGISLSTVKFLDDKGV